MKRLTTDTHGYTRIKSVLICVHLWFLIFSFPAQAQIPDVYKQKYWSLPGCNAPEMHLVFSDHYIMTMDGVSAHVETVAASEQSGDYFVIEGKMQSFVLRHDEKTGALYRYFPLASDIGGLDLDDGANGYRIDYMRCDGARDGGLNWKNIVEKLDFIKSKESLFAAIDANTDAKLDLQELEQAALGAIWLTAANSCDFAAVFDVSAKNRAQGVAAETLSLADTDKNNTLDINELQARWPLLKGGSKAGPLLKEAASLYTLFSFLPESAPHHTCITCSTAAPCGKGVEGCDAN